MHTPGPKKLTDDSAVLAEVFSGFSSDLQLKIRSAGKIVDFSFGDLLLEEGNLASRFFILLDGEVRVISASNEQTIAILTPGACFGEVSIIYKRPVSATVRARKNSRVLAIEAEELREICRKFPDFEFDLQRLGRRRRLYNFLNDSTIFGELSAAPLMMLAGALKEKHLQCGAYIIREKDPPGPLYILKSGKVRVVRERGGLLQDVAYLRAGDYYFGERALLTGENRAATVIAVTSVKLLVLPEEALKALSSAFSEIDSVFRRKISEYEEETIPLRPLDFASLTEEGQLESFSVDQKAESDQKISGKDYPFVPQLYENDCGIACLLTVAKWHGSDVSRRELMQKALRPDAGTSSRALVYLGDLFDIELLEKFHWNADLNAVKLPAILHMQDQHWIVCFERTDNHWIISDPSRGLKCIDTDTLSCSWSGHLLECPGVNKKHRNYFSFNEIFYFCFPNGLSFSLFGILLSVSILTVLLSALAGWTFPIIVASGSSSRLSAWSLLFIVSFVVLILRTLLYSRLSLLLQKVSSSCLDKWFLSLLSDRYGQTAAFTPGDTARRVEAAVSFHSRILNPVVTIIISGLTLLVALLAITFISFSVAAWLFSSLLLIGLLLLNLLQPAAGRPVDELREQYLKEVSEEAKSLPSVLHFYSPGAMMERWHRPWKIIEQQLAVERELEHSFAALTATGLLIVLLSWIPVALSETLSFQIIGCLSGLSVILTVSCHSIINNLLLIRERMPTLERLLDLKEEQHSRLLPGRVMSIEGRIECRGLVLLAADGSALNASFSATLEPGRHYHILADNSELRRMFYQMLSGESTAYSGSLTFDLVERAVIDSGGLRSFIGIFGATLLPGSVWDNVTCLRDIDPKFVRKLMVELGGDELIQDLPQGYATPASDPAVTDAPELKRKIELARIVCQRPSIIVVDERFRLSEEERDLLQKLLPHKVTIVSLSDSLLSYTGGVEFILFHGNECIEQGLHQELMNRKGLYYSMRGEK